MRAIALALLIGCAVSACGDQAPAGDDATPVSPDEAHRCLLDEQGSFKVEGPRSREPHDDDAPDTTFLVAGLRATAYLAYYDEKARAEQAAPERREHAKQFGGAVDRYGNLTIIWVRGQETSEADAIESCALQ